VVLKPAVGSWAVSCQGQRSRRGPKSLLDTRRMLASYHHSIFYIQRLSETGRDIRAFVIGDEWSRIIERSAH